MALRKQLRVGLPLNVTGLCKCKKWSDFHFISDKECEGMLLRLTPEFYLYKLYECLTGLFIYTVIK